MKKDGGKNGRKHSRNAASAALSEGFASLKSGLKDDFLALRYRFTARSFFALFFGALILGACWFCYLAPLVYMCRHLDLLSVGLWVQLFFGTIGFLGSNLLIVLVSVHTAAGRGPQATELSHSLLSDALKEQGAERKKKLAIALALYLAIWAAGFAALGFYIRDEVRYRNYIEVPAVIEMAFSHGDGYTLRYGYDVDGAHYTYTGTAEYGGSAAPQVGDTVYFKIDPADPHKIYAKNESPALVFAVFLLGCGVFLVAYELSARGKFPLPFMLALAMWLIPAVAFVAIFASSPVSGYVPVLARTPAMQIVLLFVYGGALECVCGFLSLGKKRS